VPKEERVPSDAEGVIPAKLVLAKAGSGDLQKSSRFQVPSSKLSGKKYPVDMRILDALIPLKGADQ